jgi:glycosyltransferase involved in cell wall biosynthesis
MTAPSDKRPLVSVIVRTCSWRRHMVLNCLRSIDAQDYRKIEIVVVEDGGDETRAGVARFRRATDLAVQYHSIPKGGRCVAGNFGLKSAKGALLGFLDDDDELFPDHVSSLVEFLGKRPELVGAYTRSLEVPATIKSYDPLEVIDSPGQPFREREFSYAQLCYQNFLPIQSVMFRRELFERFGGFDVELDQLEDWDLWTRYFSAGEPALVNKVTSFFRVPASRTETLQRNSLIDRYFPVAVQKQRRMLVEIGRGEIIERLYEIELDKMLARSAVTGWIKAHPAAKSATIRLLNVVRRGVKFMRRNVARAISVVPPPAVERHADVIPFKAGITPQRIIARQIPRRRAA